MDNTVRSMLHSAVGVILLVILKLTVTCSHCFTYYVNLVMLQRL